MSAVLLNFFTSLFFLLSFPVGGGYWRKSAPSDGERPDCPGQGRSAGLCLAGKLQQWGSLHREPAEALQRKPYLCNYTSFLHMFENILVRVVKHTKCVPMFWLRHILAQCWCQWTLTKSWRFTPSNRWIATEGSASMRYRLTCESLHGPQTTFFEAWIVQ